MPPSLHARTNDPLSALAAGVLARDGRIIERFVRVIGPTVLRIVRQILGVHHPEVPDVVQESIFAAIDSLPRFRNESTVLHFVCRVAALTAMNARRRWQLRERYAAEVADLDEFAAPEPSPYGLAVAAKRRCAFRELLDELPASQAEALVLHAVLGWTVEEAAAASGVAVNTVRSRLIAAKSLLRKRLVDDPDLRELMLGGS